MASKVTRVYVQESYGPDVQIPLPTRNALLSGVSSSGRGYLLRPWNRCVGDELAFAGRQSIRPVATLTLLGCRLVKEDLPIPDDSNLFVASNTADVLVQTLQGKRSPLVVVEKRRLPLRTVVTIHASSHAILLKLLAMNVLVAVLALDGRSREVSGDELGFQVGRLVAVDAGRRLVRAQERERRIRVVEAREFLPRFGGVASLATGGRSVGAPLLHAFRKLSSVRVSVAGRAGKILPVIKDDRPGRTFRMRQRLVIVAISAGNGDVSAG